MLLVILGIRNNILSLDFGIRKRAIVREYLSTPVYLSLFHKFFIENTFTMIRQVILVFVRQLYLHFLTDP